MSAAITAACGLDNRIGEGNRWTQASVEPWGVGVVSPGGVSIRHIRSSIGDEREIDTPSFAHALVGSSDVLRNAIASDLLIAPVRSPLFVASDGKIQHTASGGNGNNDRNDSLWHVRQAGTALPS